MSIYVLLSDEHQVLILHDTKKSDASHPYLSSDEFLNRPGLFGPTASAYKIAICFLLSSANLIVILFYSQNTLCGQYKNCWLCWISKRSIVFVASLLAKYFVGEPEGTCKFFRSINELCTGYATVTELHSLHICYCLWVELVWSFILAYLFPWVFQHCLDSSFFLFQSCPHPYLNYCPTLTTRTTGLKSQLHLHWHLLPLSPPCISYTSIYMHFLLVTSLPLPGVLGPGNTGVHCKLVRSDYLKKHSVHLAAQILCVLQNKVMLNLSWNVQRKEDSAVYSCSCFGKLKQQYFDCVTWYNYIYFTKYAVSFWFINELFSWCDTRVN